MKKLLTKTLTTFVLYSLVVLAASVPVYYYLVDRIWLRELDEQNEIIARRTENELNRLNLENTELSESIALWNKIQPGTNLKRASGTMVYPDSTYTVLRQNPYVEYKNMDRFRGLVKLIYINQEPYFLTVETNVEETEETVAAIAAVTLLFFLILVIGFLLLSRRLSVRLWKPFRSTLARLKTFKLNSQTPVIFERSDTLEFEELNAALGKLLEHTLVVYRTQKEFTENASHELQTPLAIIKNKLDLLLQKESLTDRQYRLIEEINNVLTRISRINKNLLLLAKIENNQFDAQEKVDISQLAQQSLAQFDEHSGNKNIMIQDRITNGVTVKGNKTLIEILLNNLLVNAIRHNIPYGTIIIELDHRGVRFSNPGTIALDEAAVFKRFVKRSPENTGSGLGLAIIKQICHCHHWTVHYQFKNTFHHFSIRFN